ncbi:MAG: hypothetical protein H6600_08780 [Flavobacteriales bacterium]|nr:hypothetical protein [Flavobacteriales bacterium]MCB9196376.1 hypothetical protein [Flavobacteriales bacterium]MCB9198541.1 hypothetical protein [Flavobacteriales bacterium]
MNKNIVFAVVMIGVSSLASCGKNKVACDGSTRTYTADIKSIIDASCVSCHANYSTYSGVKASVSNGTFESEVISKQTMPQGSKLSDADLTKIKCWLEQGAPEN